VGAVLLGEGAAGLARATWLSAWTVQHLLKRFRDRGEDGLRVDYGHRERLVKPAAAEVRAAA
jgi:hypothetical protein